MTRPLPLIELRDATVYRGDTRVFNGLSLTINQGESTAIIGPNGSGKSTFLKLLTREVYPVVASDSFVRILGQDRPVLWDLRSQIGLISQDLQNQYRPAVAGRDIILSGFFGSIGLYDYQQLEPRQVRKADEIMDELDITSLAGRPFDTMSTGQQRRFLLGRALIHSPHSLVLDEPTSGLDLHATFQYLGLIRDFIRTGGTVLLVTHHIHEIPPEVERIVLIDDGKMIADGHKAELLTSERLSTLFDIPVSIVEANGYFQAVPG